MTEDAELARRMRAGLERRAREADTTAPVVSRARAAARRRRGARLAGLAAAAVAAVAVTGVVVDRAGSPGGVDRPGAVDEPSGEVANGPWRTEYWRDLRVDVPADWGYGGAPQEGGSGDGGLRCRGHGVGHRRAAPGGGPDDAVRRSADRADRPLRGVPVDRPERRAAAGALRVARRRRRARDGGPG